MSKNGKKEEIIMFFSYINYIFFNLFTHTLTHYLNLCFWEMMVGWFDWRYHICLITSMHLKGYWTWKVLKDITKYCGSKWLALSSQSVLGSARDCHYWSFDFNQLLWLVSTDDSQMTWSAWVGLYLILCTLCGEFLAQGALCLY